VELGEVDGLGELAPDACRAGRGGGDQPRLSAWSDLKERLLVGAAGAGLAPVAPAGLRVTRSVDARAAPRRQRVPRGLARSARAVAVHDDKPATLDSRPHPFVDERRRDESAARRRPRSSTAHDTLRVSPKQTVCAIAGNRCNRARSSASITAGAPW
jgi:hypothetical protein